MNRSGRTALRAGACLLAGASFGGTTMAQDGPIIIGQTQALPTFYFEPLRGEVSVESFFSRSSLSDTSGTSTFTQYRIDEILTLATNGHIVSPNLVDLKLDNTFGLSQGEFRSDGDSSRELGFLYEFDNQATFLRDEAVPLTLYGRRTQTLVNRTFGPTLDSTQTTYGGYSTFNLGPVRNRIEAFRSNVEQAGITGPVDFTLEQDTLLWNGLYNPADNQTVTWDYIYSGVDQSRPGFDSAFTTHDARLSHLLDFGPNRGSNLTSTLRYFDQSGDFAISSLHWDESLRLRHTDRLTTIYRYNLQHRTTESTEQVRHRGSAGFRHKLFDSLITSGNVGGQDIRFDDEAASREYFGNLNLDYRKRVPLGHLTAGVGTALNRQENDARATSVRVVDELLTFSDSIPIVIIGRNIVPDSIILTDTAGVEVFTPDLDYVVRALPDRVEIERVLGGRLEEGQSVLVDYLLASQPGNVVTTGRFSTHLRYDIEEGPLKGIAGYVRYAQQEQTIDSAMQEAFVDNSFTDTVGGLEYRRGPLTLDSHRQWHHSEVLPFEATRFSARYAHRPAPRTLLSLDGNYAITDFLDDDNRVRLLSAAGRARHWLTPQFSVAATVLWRNEEDDRRGATDAFEQQLEVEWRHRQTRVFFRGRNVVLDSPGRESSFQIFSLGLRREF